MIPTPALMEATDAHPELGELTQSVASSNWPAVARLFDALPDNQARSLAVRVAAEVPGAETFLDAAAGDPECGSLAKVLCAARHIVLAWEVRTGARAKNVSAQQFAVFHASLRRAELLLLDVCAREPHHPLAWVERLTTAMGLELGPNEARRRFDQLRHENPNCYRAQGRMVQILAPKWAGTWESMFAFAREQVAASAPGSFTGAVIVEAHVEKWLDLPAQGRRAYLQRPEVAAEVAAAAEHSVLHKDFRKGFGWTTPVSDFAFYYSVVGEHRTAARYFTLLGPYGSRLPWAYVGDATARFTEHREKAAKAQARAGVSA